MSTEKNLIKNISSLGIIQIANFVMPLISVPIISRIIGPERFGAISYVATFVVYFNLFIGYGFNLTAVRKLSQDSNNIKLRSQVFSQVLYCQSLLFIVTISIYSILIFIIPELANNKKLAIYGILFCVSSVLTQNWLFQAMQDLTKVTILNILGKVIYLVTILILIKTKEDYYWQPLMLSVSQIIISIISFFWAKKQYEVKIIRIRLEECIKILWDEKTVFMSIILTSFYTTINMIVLGIMQNELQVGYFAAGQKLILVAQTVITLPLAQVFYPYIGKSIAINKEIALKKIQKLIPIILIITCFIGITIIIVGPYIIKLFYGKSFYPAVECFQFLAFIPMLVSINNILGVQVMLNFKMENKYFKAILFSSLISVLSNILLIQILGVVGASINWLLTEMILTILLFTMIKRQGIKIYNKDYYNIGIIRKELNPIINKYRAVAK